MYFCSKFQVFFKLNCQVPSFFGHPVMYNNPYKGCHKQIEKKYSKAIKVQIRSDFSIFGVITFIV